MMTTACRIPSQSISLWIRI